MREGRLLNQAPSSGTGSKEKLDKGLHVWCLFEINVNSRRVKGQTLGQHLQTTCAGRGEIKSTRRVSWVQNATALRGRGEAFTFLVYLYTNIQLS